MGRIRTVKPDFFANDSLAELSHAHRLLFIGLWTLADRAGRMEDRPQRIWAQLFPYEDGVDVDAMLDDLAAGGFIGRYEVEGERLIEISGFLKHQRPHPKEPQSELPGMGGKARTHGRPSRWVYFVQAEPGGPIKIGTASNVAMRVDSLQTSHHERLVVLATVPAQPSTEREMHARFASDRIRGEWFNPSLALLAFIGSATKAGDERPCIPDASPSIPSSPVGREGKGREGDLGREGVAVTAAAAPPAAALVTPPPSLPAAVVASAIAFWVWAQDERRKRYPKASPDSRRTGVEDWYARAVVMPEVTDERLRGSWLAYLEDDWARARKPICAFQPFMHEEVWPKHLPNQDEGPAPVLRARCSVPMCEARADADVWGVALCYPHVSEWQGSAAPEAPELEPRAALDSWLLSRTTPDPLTH